MAFLCPFSVFAQKWEFGIHAGMAGYMGDFNQENIFKFNDWGIGASAKYNLNPTWGLRMNLSQINIHGDDANSKYIFEQERNESFTQSLTELAVLADFNFFKFEPDYKKNQWTPYLSAGLGGFVFHEMNGNVLTQDDPDNRFMLIRYGLGFKYNVKKNWSLGAELAYRTPFSFKKNHNAEDESDDSERYISFDGIDSKRSDAYMTLQFTLIYTLFCKTCPRW